MTAATSLWWCTEIVPSAKFAPKIVLTVGIQANSDCGHDSLWCGQIARRLQGSLVLSEEGRFYMRTPEMLLFYDDFEKGKPDNNSLICFLSPVVPVTFGRLPLPGDGSSFQFAPDHDA